MQLQAEKWIIIIVIKNQLFLDIFDSGQILFILISKKTLAYLITKIPRKQPKLLTLF